MDVICRDDSRAEQTCFFCLFSSTFVSATNFCRGKKRSHNSLGLLNHQITESWFMTGVGGVGFGEFQEKHDNHVPVFYLVEHFRESQPPGTITHQWRPTTDRGQISMRSLSATVTWCLENYEKMGLLGRSVARWSIWIFWMKWWLICNKRLYLECVGSPYHSSSLFGYMIALCRRIKLSGAELVIPFSFFLFTYPMLWLCTPHFRVHHKHLNTTNIRNRFGDSLRNSSTNERMAGEMHPRKARRPLRSWRKASRKLKRIPFLRRFHGNKGIFGKEGFQPKPPRLVLGQEKSGMKQTLIWL